VQFWSSLANQQTALMTHTLRSHFPESFVNACWATYIRCHDDIGWAITDEDAAAVPGMSAMGHRNYLADFYSGKFSGSFARGALFQENTATGDRRNSGSFASLAGLEAALEAKDDAAIIMAVERMLLGFALIASFGGLPLLYMGDEIGLLNDYDFVSVPEHAHDNRWLHRPKMDWKKAKSAHAGKGPEGRLLAGVRHVMIARKSQPCLAAGNPCRIIDVHASAIFAFVRDNEEGRLHCLFNFSPDFVSVSESVLRAHGVGAFRDVLCGGFVPVNNGQIAMMPYGRLWLE